MIGIIAQQLHSPDWRARAFFGGSSNVYTMIEVWLLMLWPAGDA